MEKLMESVNYNIARMNSILIVYFKQLLGEYNK